LHHYTAQEEVKLTSFLPTYHDTSVQSSLVMHQKY